MPRAPSLATSLATSLAASVAASFAVGCGIAGESGPIELSGPPPMVGFADSHSETGPHGGRLIELGHNHKFHAELLVEELEGENRRVRLIALDRSLEKLPQGIDRVAICTFAQGTANTFELPAHSTGEYVSTDPALVALLSASGPVACKIRLKIGEKSYTGLFDHRDHAVREVANDKSPAGAADFHTSQRPREVRQSLGVR